MALALALAALIELSLGLLGSGGSIITLPVLVYIADIPAQQAVGMSLVIVGGTSAIGSLLNMRQGAFNRLVAHADFPAGRSSRNVRGNGARKAVVSHFFTTRLCVVRGAVGHRAGWAESDDYIAEVKRAPRWQAPRAVWLF